MPANALRNMAQGQKRQKHIIGAKIGNLVADNAIRGLQQIGMGQHRSFRIACRAGRVNNRRRIIGANRLRHAVQGRFVAPARFAALVNSVKGQRTFRFQFFGLAVHRNDIFQRGRIRAKFLYLDPLFGVPGQNSPRARIFHVVGDL